MGFFNLTKLFIGLNIFFNGFLTVFLSRGDADIQSIDFIFHGMQAFRDIHQRSLLMGNPSVKLFNRRLTIFALLHFFLNADL